MNKPVFTVEELERIEQAIISQEFRSHAIAYNDSAPSDDRDRHREITDICEAIRHKVSEYLNEIEVKNEVKDLHEGIAKLLS